ncbi:GH92 family glycosyl hydrolase [Tahibacter amnicola]|uniref:GH92 family glycosyl hydrolase n=2 Tax=Tahibacter amnicola TaxID=2976241 RepID=A0ABY6BQI0_9GAMM|nr:GH92 family glycosyl hydrolase [Tahibacter amnicola]UXI70675.1 GH92 family glycosyl hydrolase [Tahibacter amnicola]
MAETVAAVDPVTQVNTFIGTKDDGNTFPGAAAPFGMIQVSPIGEHYAGWRYDEAKIRGFGHFFLSGAGCWEQGGQIAILPVTGEIGPGQAFDTTVAASFDYRRYAATATHEGEVGQAGYYRTRLTDYGGIDVEATALTRAAAERYTFGSAKTGHVLVNLGQANERHRVMRSVANIVGDRVVEGEVETLSFCGGTRYTTWFRLVFDRPFRAFGTWNASGGHADTRQSTAAEGPNGAWLSFDTQDAKSVTVTSAVSHVDADGARRNLAADAQKSGLPLTFEAMKAKAQKTWRTELDSVRISGAAADDRVVFTTALYHTFLQPLTGSDSDGRYRGWDNQIHRAKPGTTYYEFFSLWDTYRSQNQWLAMLRPHRARDIADSILAIHQQGGWLPRWGYANYETNVMTGDPVTPFLVDLWRFGALAGREAAFYKALVQNADGIPPVDSRSQGRIGNETYLSQGFVYYDKQAKPKSMDIDLHHGGSATLEYALADCSLAQFAAAMQQPGDARRYAERGRSWRTVWDASVDDAERGFVGFPRPRTRDGSWYTPADGPYRPSSDHGFHEGTAWQYQWLVQQDVPGLVQAMGGLEKARRRLDVFFAYDNLVADPARAARKDWVVGPYAYYNQFRYNPNNEPDLHSPWMYTLLGQPWKTSAVVRAAQTLFTHAPNGVTGNDDLGTMSAWYLFSAIGLYPAVPGTGQFLLHAPRFERIEMDLGKGRVLRIEAPGADARRMQYVRSVSVDGATHSPVWLDWEGLRKGGTIRFGLTDSPDAALWGREASAAPASPCAAATATAMP